MSHMYAQGMSFSKCEMSVQDSDEIRVFFQWNSSEFKRTLADVLTSHCTLNPCLDEMK